MTTRGAQRQIVDRFGRVHSNLRISVTDRCNIRCFYCMPLENVRFLPQHRVLTFEEITRFAEVACSLGVNRIRITGGEPLVRTDLDQLIGMLSSIEMIDDLALTTNGLLLAEQAHCLKESGLQRLNISLDTLSESVFEQITRRTGLQKVLDGIDAAIEVGFDRIRLNAIAIRGLTENEVVPLTRFAMQKGLELRFIEFMPLDAEENWESQQVLSGAAIRQIIESEVGELVTASRKGPSQPAVDFEFIEGDGRIGFINPVTEPFCDSCNRLRITAEGQIRNCLFSTSEWDARELLRSGATDEELRQLIHECVGAKSAAHGIDSDSFERPQRAMYQIGG